MALEMKYFVLKPKGTDPYAAASRDALVAYAETIKDADPELADSLWRWVHQIVESMTPNAKL